MQIEKPLLFPPTGCSVFKAYPVIFLGSMIALSALGNFELEQRPNRSSQSWVFGANASPYQPNRVLINKPPRIRLIIPEEVVMRPVSQSQYWFCRRKGWWIVRLVLLALKTKAGLRLRHTARNYLNSSNNFSLNSANSSDKLFLSSV